MVRKKKRRRPGKQFLQRKNRKQGANHIDRGITNRVLAHMYLVDKALSSNDLVKALGITRSSKQMIERIIENLCEDGILCKSRNNHFALDKKQPFATATFEKNPRGFGFGTNLSFRSKQNNLKKDPFIPAAKTATARHGDRVLLKIKRLRRDDRPEAEVIHILERTINRLTGFYRHEGPFGTVYPEDPRFPFSVIISAPPEQEIPEGDAVIVTLSDTSEQNPGGKIVTVLGNPKSIAVQTQLVIEKYDLPHQFGPEALNDASSALPSPGKKERCDLRDIQHITIDGSDAKDFDDAIAVKKTRTGYRLYVSIADVSAFVVPDSDLDREAYERGTSVYFPGTVIPMLPEHLSNNLCSLKPHEDRLAVTAILDFDRQGSLLKKKFIRSVIQSHHRFTYDTVRQIVVDREPAVRSTHKPFLTPLKWAAELAEKLQKKRQNRGSIGFTIPEANIELDTDGTVLSITRKINHFAHVIIEEFMLAANEAVAATFTEQACATLYRVHEEPDQEKRNDFITFAKTLGITIPASLNKPGWFNEILENVSGTPREYIVNNLLLRTMQQAHYSAQNNGHYGLAADNYTHFTSPIRRYPDLIVHRLLCQLIDKNDAVPFQPSKKYSAQSLEESGIHLSRRERIAVSSERDMVDRLKRLFMASQVGSSFQAVISGVSETQFFVELTETFASGSISLATMKDDFYILDTDRHRLVGDISAKTYQIGDIVEVVLVDIDHQRGKMHFKLAEHA